MKKNVKGITLVSLVITIIVMLILAGVSISMATGNNGVLTRGQQASKRTNLASVQEDLTLAVTSVQADYEAEWAMDSTFASKKAKYVTIKEMNKYLTKCKILSYAGDAAAATGSAEKTFGSNKIKVFTDGTPLSVIAGDCGLNSADSTATDCGKALSVLFLGNGSDQTQLGTSLYVALYYMNNGIPTFVDVGLLSKETTSSIAADGTLIVASGTASGKLAATGDSKIDDAELTWLNGKEAANASIPGGTD